MRTNGHGKPVVALDIDGTLGDYHGHFIRFASGYFDREFPSAEEVNPGLPLWRFMDLTKEQYRECKLAYRQGGLKRTMPAYAGASQLTTDIRVTGAEVWICTTRPYLRLDNIDPDTREWLRRNRIGYDAVLFDRIEEKGSKYAELKRQAGDRVCAILDDLPEMLDLAEEEWHGSAAPPKLFLRDQPYNRHADRWRRVTSPWTAWQEIRHAINDWKVENRGE